MYHLNRKTLKHFLIMIMTCIMVFSISFPSCAQTSSSKISLSLNGKYAIIMDMDTGQVLYSKNAKTKCHNASTTKLVTAIVAIEKNKSLKKKIRITKNANNLNNADVVKLGMKQGDRYYLKDLLYAMLIPSSNDCAVAIAEGTCGSVDKFMKEVNGKVKKIGCKKTKFGTPSGLRSSKTHYTTAYDLALITKYAYSNPTIRKILKTKKYSFKSLGGRKHKVVTTNELLESKRNYCIGKTGTGGTAKYCFTGVYKYKGYSFVIVTLGSRKEEERFSDAKKMMEACRRYLGG